MSEWSLTTHNNIYFTINLKKAAPLSLDTPMVIRTIIGYDGASSEQVHLGYENIEQYETTRNFMQAFHYFSFMCA